jgi:hypothetical protein
MWAFPGLNPEAFSCRELNVAIAQASNAYAARMRAACVKLPAFLMRGGRFPARDASRGH